jgi:multimeric flavodoxin WrbA
MADETGPSVLGILGSPRVRSNTGMLLARLLAGAEAAGARVETVQLRLLDCRSCRHCGGCDRTGLCVVQDDMGEVIGKIRAARHLVLASPIHFSGVSGEMKTMIDRGQALWVERYRLKRIAPAGRRGVYLATCGGSDRRVFDWAKHTVLAFLNSAGFEYWGELFEANTDRPPPIGERAEVLARAERLGRELIENHREEQQ